MASKNNLDKAQALINLALSGEDPAELVGNTVRQFQEGSGPFAIGNKVKINKAITAEKADGGTVALSQGDYAWIVNPYMGETGTDKMILLSDGVTKAVVPLTALGEEEAGVGGEVPSASGKQSAKDSANLGDPAPQGGGTDKKGSKTTIDANVQGEGEPKGGGKSKGGGSASSIDGKEVGSTPKGVTEITKELNKVLVTTLSPLTRKQVTDIKDALKRADEETIRKVETMFNGEENYTLADLHQVLFPVNEEIKAQFASLNIAESIAKRMQ